MDNSSIDNFVNSKIINNYGFADEIIVFKKSRNALKYLSGLNDAPMEKIPFVLFLDLDMPEINGFEFLNSFTLLADKIKKNMKIVILTSSYNPADHDKCMKHDSVIAFFHKPLIKSNLEAIELMFVSGNTCVFSRIRSAQ